MLESNWVRVCELEERSLNVSHCCRGQTDSERRKNNDKDKNKRQWAKCSDITCTSSGRASCWSEATLTVSFKCHFQFCPQDNATLLAKLASPTFLLTSEAAWEQSQAGYLDIFFSYDANFNTLVSILVPEWHFVSLDLQLHSWHKFSIFALFWSTLKKRSHTFHFFSDPNFLSEVKKKTCVQELLVSTSTMWKSTASHFKPWDLKIYCLRRLEFGTERQLLVFFFHFGWCSKCVQVRYPALEESAEPSGAVFNKR